MTPTETLTLVRLTCALWPAMRLDEHTPDAWHDVLGDLPADLALAAVRRLAKVSRGYIGPADIRREVYRAAGLLAPDPALTFAEVVRVASNWGDGRAGLHPLAAAAYDAMGGARTIAGMPSWAARRDFDQTWERLAGQAENDLLAGDFERATETRPRALP